MAPVECHRPHFSRPDTNFRSRFPSNRASARQSSQFCTVLASTFAVSQTFHLVAFFIYYFGEYFVIICPSQLCLYDCVSDPEIEMKKMEKMKMKMSKMMFSNWGDFWATTLPPLSPACPPGPLPLRAIWTCGCVLERRSGYAVCL